MIVEFVGCAPMCLTSTATLEQALDWAARLPERFRFDFGKEYSHEDINKMFPELMLCFIEQFEGGLDEN